MSINERKKSSKSCDLKGRQKLFLLQQHSAASCCRADAQSLDQFVDIDQLLNHWDQERQELDKGVEVSSCRYCWQQEDNGQLSYRQMPKPATTNWVEIWVDNSCNQMCSYCSPKFSSLWENNVRQHGTFEKISHTSKQNQSIHIHNVIDTQWLDKIFDYIRNQPVNSVTVNILGGEPLMQIRQLEKLVNLNIDNVFQLRITTNLNPPNNKFLVWLLQKIPAHRLFFHISIDATPEFNHVPRAGFDAAKFLTNLDLVRRAGVQYNFLSVASVLNIFDIANMVSWCRSENHPLQILPLNNPDCLDARLLPEYFKDQLRFDLMPDLVADILKPADTIDLKLFEQYNYISQYFSRTGIEPLQTSNLSFRAYWQWLENKFQ